MASTSNIVGTAWIERKAQQAQDGNNAALEQLQNAYIREVKRANQQARTLDRKGYDTPALMQYRKGMNGQFLSQSKNLDIEEMVKNMKRAERFMKSKTYTIQGENERRAKMFESLRKPQRDERGRFKGSAFLKPPPEGMTKLQQERKLAQFLTNKHFEELKKYLDSGIIQQAADAINRGIPVIRLSRLFNEYMKETKGVSNREKKKDLDMVWSTFLSGEMHINPHEDN